MVKVLNFTERGPITDPGPFSRGYVRWKWKYMDAQIHKIIIKSTNYYPKIVSEYERDPYFGSYGFFKRKSLELRRLRLRHHPERENLLSWLLRVWKGPFVPDIEAPSGPFDRAKVPVLLRILVRGKFEIILTTAPNYGRPNSVQYPLPYNFPGFFMQTYIFSAQAFLTIREIYVRNFDGRKKAVKLFFFIFFLAYRVFFKYIFNNFLVSGKRLKIHEKFIGGISEKYIRALLKVSLFWLRKFIGVIFKLIEIFKLNLLEERIVSFSLMRRHRDL